MFIGIAPHVLRPLAAIVTSLRPQDVFATSLYTGTGSVQQVNTGFSPDLSWLKVRSTTGSHFLLDSLRGTKSLSSDTTAAETEFGSGVNASGFQATAGSGSTNVGWSLKRTAKFFDVVTYTGDGTNGRQIAHSLGVAPGMIVIKGRNSNNNWPVYHRSIGTDNLYINTTAGSSSDGFFPSTPTGTVFSVSASSVVNASGGTYVAYIFAHDPDTTNGIIQCGSFTVTTGSAITLGWKPQFIIIKASSITGSWFLLDTTRGWGAGSDAVLRGEGTNAEGSFDLGASTATGFTHANLNEGSTVVYCAIRAPV